MGHGETPLLGHKRRLAVSAAILLLITGFLASAVLAVFTDLTTSDGNTFTSGTVDLTVAPATAAITLSGMAPGDRIAKPIDVTNSGVLDLRYAVDSATTDDVLASALELTVKSGVTDCSSSGFDLSGAVVYGPAPLGATTTLPILGDAAQGDDAGDRTLAAGASEVLCLDVTLPFATGNASAGLATTATFTFHAEQTTGNP